MQILKPGLAQLILVGAVGLVLASPALALELPDVHVLSSESYPATAEGAVEGVEVAVLETEIGEKLTASGAQVTTELQKLTSLLFGVFTLTSFEDHRIKTSCHGVGQPAGTVVIEGEEHVVDTSTAPLMMSYLFLFKEITIECGKEKRKLRGMLLYRVEKVTSGTDVTQYGLIGKCAAKGKQELTEYFNDEGVRVKSVLSANFGLGFENACLAINKELVLTSSKMVDFLF
jgi:hypothetical protein